MCDRYLEILKESAHKGNFIPSGRQLHRTPPLPDVKRHLNFCSDSSLDLEEQQRNVERRSQNNHNSTFDSPDTPETKPGSLDDPNSMLKGMKGYQLIPSDLEFIEKMKEEKLIKNLQSELEEAQRLLKKETMAAELVIASREKAQAELKKFPSCEEITEWVKVVLGASSPSVDLTDVDAKSLLATVTKEDVQRVIDGKRTELRRMEKMVANKRKKEAKERAQLEKQITVEQLKIQGLMRQLTDLKFDLARETEACEALDMPFKVEAEKVDTSEELPAAKSQVRSRGKERKQAVKSTEKLQDATNQNKSKSKLTDSRSSLKDDRENKKTSETLKTKQKSAEKQTKPVRAAGGPQRRKTEEKDSDLQESEQAVKGRRKPPGGAQTAASQAKNQSKVRTGEAADDGEEAQHAGLRRSKRIASRSSTHLQIKAKPSPEQLLKAL
ncbi:uncharacterized protein LOC104928335 isoform X2 [Larimichthys crocea]|uniref:uncharacterized protein LOC104928335 isoform X2 n=1 Tax=Larimichthys crocea TaxID=215358 RepID=UPI000F5F669D|nr:uncharacterized protein LOC104928335 isoform X2 [Larimichthys crocea]